MPVREQRLQNAHHRRAPSIDLRDVEMLDDFWLWELLHDAVADFFNQLAWNLIKRKKSDQNRCTPERLRTPERVLSRMTLTFFIDLWAG